jgi:tetratricopeptide (TPR) repeat protein
VAALASGCVSTQERYERVEAYRARGQVVDAAYAMVDVLEDDAQWPGGRRELLSLGREAFGVLMNEARTLREQGRPVEALTRLERVEDLHDAARDVDVTLPRPEGLADTFAATRQDAYDVFVARAEAAEARADWGAARAAYDEARAYATSEAQRADLRRRAYAALERHAEAAEARADWRAARNAYTDARAYVASDADRLALDRREADVLYRWAQDDRDRRAYRAAYDRAASALATLPDRDAARARQLRAFQDEVVEKGTRTVAFLPLWRTDAASKALPPGFVTELNDVLRLSHWSEPPRFVASVPGPAVRRATRRAGADRAIVTRTQAALVARDLDAPWAVTGEVTTFRTREDDVERRTRAARLSDTLTDTTYVVESLDLTMRAVAEVRLVDAERRRTQDTFTVEARAEGPIQRGVFAGDWRALDLRGSEVSLFDPDDQRQRRRQIETRLAENLARAIAEATFARITDEIE